MAKRLNYTIGIDADTSKLELQLNKAYESLSKIGNSQQITTNLQKASSSALELANNLSKAINQNTGKLDLSVFNDNLKRSGQTLNSYYDQLVQLGPAGQDAFLQVASAVVQAELPIKRTSKLLDSLWITMKNTMRWQLTSSALHGFTGALEQAYGYAKSLDGSLNNIRIVSNKSADDMARFAEQANKAAKALSTTTTDYTDASLIYYQQGLTDQEVLDRTETTIKMANVAGTTAETASQQLTAIWNNFYDGSQTLDHYADVMVKLGAATASSSDEISEGIEKFAAVANTVGLSYEYAASALATVTAQTRESANVVGTAFRTLFSRIQGLNLGETLDDGTTLNKYSQALATVGVQIKDTDGELKGMDEILDDLGSKWSTLAQDQKIALAETVAGVRQWTQLIALMDNWDFFKENLAMAQNADGTLEEQAKIYAESWEAARDRTKAAAEDIYDSLINSDFYIEIDNLITPILSGTAEIIDSLGGLKGVLLVAASAMTALYGDKMAEGIRDMAHNIGIMTGYEQIKARMLQQEGASLTDEIAGMDTKYQLESKMMNLRHQANVESDYLNAHQKQLLQADIDDLEVLRQKTNELLKQKEASESLIRSRVNAVSSRVEAGAANLNSQTASTPKEAKYISKIFSNYQASGNQITQQKTAVAALTQEYKKVSEQVSRVNVVMGAFEQNGEKLGKTRQDVKAMGEDFKRTAKNIGLFDTKLNETEHLEKMEKASANLIAKLTLLRNEIEVRGGDTSFLDELDFDIQDLTRTLAAAGVSEEDFANKLNKVSTAIEQQGYRIETTADKIVRLGQVAGQGLMALEAVRNLGRVFSDEDMSAGDRLIAIFTSLSMILPLVGNATKSLTAGLKVQNIASLVAEGLADRSKLSNIDNIVLRTIVTKIINKQTAATNGQTAALGAEAMAQTVVNSSLLAFLGYAALVVAAVAAIGAVIYALVKAYNADADAAKKQSEQLEKMTNAYNEANSAAEELKNTINNWTTARQSIDNLRKDTEEYAQAVKDANDKARELIETQGLFDSSKWSYQNGIIEFAEGTLEELQDQADKQAQKTEDSLSTKQYYSAQANQKSDDTDFRREITDVTNAKINTASTNLISFFDTEIPKSFEEFTSKFSELRLTATEFRDLKNLIENYLKTQEKYVESSDYYLQKIVKGNLLGTRKDQISDIAGGDKDLENSVSEAYAARVRQLLEGKDFAINPRSYGSNEALERYIGQDINDNEDLTKMYARDILGRSDIDQLVYSSNGAKGTLTSMSGETVFEDVDFNFMRQAIAEKAKMKELIDSAKDELNQEDYEESLKNFVDATKKLGDAFGGDFTETLLNNLIQGKTETLDLSNLFGQISPEEKDKLAGMSENQLKEVLGLSDEDFQNLGFKSGKAFAESSKEALRDYDALSYWQNQASKSEKNASDIGGILQAYQDEEELSEQQNQLLDELSQKYSYLNELRTQGGHEYLQALREIQEQEEENHLTALQNIEIEQTKKANQLQQEITDLKKKQEENPWPHYQLQIDAKTEEFNKTMKDLMNTKYQIDVAVNTDLKTDVDQAFGLANEIEKLKGYVSDGLEISFDRAQEIIEAGYGEMLIGAKETANSTIMINEGVLKNFISNKQQEIEADRQSKIEQLETERRLVETKQKSVQAAIDAVKAGLQTNDKTAKAEALIQATKYKAQADAAEITAEQEADAADQSNKEISDDAEKLVGALGLMHDKNAENAQQSYQDAETAANQSAASQINALNRIQLAAVNYSNAVKASATGNAVYEPVVFAGTQNVTVGATGSKSADNTYETTAADINMTTEDILEAANHSTEVLDSALNQSLDYLESVNQGLKNEYGEIDSGIAALKSANLSLDKAQKDLGKGKGSGSKGKTYDTEDRKDPKEAEDRYHNINRALERQEDLLEDLDNATDRAWGTEALDGYEKKLKALKDQQQLYNTKLKDAEDYLHGIKGKREGDLEVVQKYFKEAQIGANGEITNYEELLQKNLKLYNAAVDRYNLAVKGKTLTEEQHTALKNQLDTEKKLFDKRQDALKQYESTIDTIRELNDNLQENARAQADLKLTEIKTKMEIVLDIKSMKDTVRDLSKEISEMFGDALTHGIESAELSMKSAQAEAALLPSYQEEWDSLKELYNSTTDEAGRKSIMDEIKNLQSNIANSAKAIADWVNSIEDIIPDAISAASERFSAFTDQLEHNTSVLDTIKELYTLQGVTYKTAAGFNRLQRNSQEKLNAQVASAELQKGWYNEAAKRLEEAQAKLDSLGGDETDLRYDTYKKARDAYLEEFNEAQEAYLSSAKEAMETAQDMYVQQIERATYLFGQAVSNNVGLDLLQDKYDHYIESEERYFDKVNEAYQVASWYNKLQQDIDDTTNVAYKNRLKALQKEIDTRKEGNKLSQYDLDILNAKYQLLQAQQALEDAQNAKNQIQLVRDSQGNWNYQYTANQDDIAKAEQDVLDAQNNWYNIAKDQTKKVAGEIVSMWQECTDAVEQLYKDLANGDISEEEYLKKKEEIEQYYAEKAKYLEEEKTQAIKDMNEAGYEELKNIAEKNGETVKEFENVYAKELESMTDSNKNFADMLDKYLQQCDDKFNNYKDTVKQVASDTGTTLGNLAEETDKVSEATDQVKQRGDEAKYTLWEMADAASSAAEKYLDLANSMWATVRAMQTLTGAQANFATSKGTKAYDENTDYTSMIIQGLANGYISYGDDTYNSLIKQLQDKAGEGANLDLDQFKSYKKGDTPSGWAAGRYNTEEEWRKNLENLKKNYGLDTGGYTGLFDDAKLAFLHQKELVLNQSDTENILAAVQAVRTIGTDLFKSIEKSLDGNAIAAMTLMSQKLNPVATIPIQDSIEQTVHIDKVEFPNVTSRTEIEEAFISLTNDAAQWARRKT